MREWAILAFRINDALFLFRGLCRIIRKIGSASLRWHGIIITVIVSAVHQILTIWSEVELLRLKRL